MYSGRKLDLDDVKKELKDEISHILYDQTRRTPIVIPVINEIGGQNNRQNSKNGGGNDQPAPRPQARPKEIQMHNVEF